MFKLVNFKLLTNNFTLQKKLKETTRASQTARTEKCFHALYSIELKPKVI